MTDFSVTINGALAATITVDRDFDVQVLAGDPDLQTAIENDLSTEKEVREGEAVGDMLTDYKTMLVPVDSPVALQIALLGMPLVLSPMYPDSADIDVDGDWDIFTDGEEKHLPGRHDQKTHGRPEGGTADRPYKGLSNGELKKQIDYYKYDGDVPDEEGDSYYKDVGQKYDAWQSAIVAYVNATDKERPGTRKVFFAELKKNKVAQTLTALYQEKLYRQHPKGYVELYRGVHLPPNKSWEGDFPEIASFTEGTKTAGVFGVVENKESSDPLVGLVVKVRVPISSIISSWRMEKDNFEYGQQEWLAVDMPKLKKTDKFEGYVTTLDQRRVNVNARASQGYNYDQLRLQTRLFKLKKPSTIFKLIPGGKRSNIESIYDGTGWYFKSTADEFEVVEEKHLPGHHDQMDHGRPTGRLADKNETRLSVLQDKYGSRSAALRERKKLTAVNKKFDQLTTDIYYGDYSKNDLLMDAIAGSAKAIEKIGGEEALQAFKKIREIDEYVLRLKYPNGTVPVFRGLTSIADVFNTGKIDVGKAIKVKDRDYWTTSDKRSAHYAAGANWFNSRPRMGDGVVLSTSIPIDKLFWSPKGGGSDELVTWKLPKKLRVSKALDTKFFDNSGYMEGKYVDESAWKDWKRRKTIRGMFRPETNSSSGVIGRIRFLSAEFDNG